MFTNGPAPAVGRHVAACSKAAQLALVLVLALPPGLAAAGEIAWSPSRALSWADFQGRVAGGAAEEEVAVTAASLSWTYEYDVQYSAGACTYRILTVSSAALFDPQRSWVRPGHDSPRVLAHEQGHFDLAQVHKLMFDAAVRDLVGATGRCEGRGIRRASRHAEREIASRVRPVYERVWRQLTSAQAAYDAATRHGLEPAAQGRWLALIAAGLQGERWDDIARAAGAGN